VSIVSELVQAA